MEKGHEKRYLRYDFSAVEVNDLSTELANKIQEQANIEAEKKAATSRLTSRLSDCKETISSLSNKVASGYEMREVNCVVAYHTPTQGMKRYTRPDINVTWDEKMTDQDYTLFNQEL
jgi:hypothetical protein